jgi:hypothetical protein
MLLSPLYLHGALRAILITRSKTDRILHTAHIHILSLSLLSLTLQIRPLCNAHTLRLISLQSTHSIYKIRQQSNSAELITQITTLSIDVPT